MTTHLTEHRIDPSDWGRWIAAPGHPQIVVGGPGTGKTEFLCRRIEAAVVAGTPPSAIIALTFSRRSVTDLRLRLFERLGSASYQINIATYHSIANRIMEHGYELTGWQTRPTVLTGPEQERFVAQLLDYEDPESWHPTFRPILTSNAFAKEMTDFILRFHEQVTPIGDLVRTGIEEWVGIGAFIERYLDALHAHGRIDYGLLLTDAVRILVSDASSRAYDLVLADEYQDTSPIQAHLLFALAGPTGALTVAADPYQSIYSFRGSNVSNVLEFPDATHAALGVRAERLVLTTSFRVPRQILDAAVRVTSRELPGAAGRVASLSESGDVASHVFDNLDSESEWIAGDIERVHLAEGVPLERVAVFTRGTGDMHERVAAALERRGIPHDHTDERLQDQPIVRFVDDLVASVTTDDDVVVTELIRAALLGPFIAAPPGAVSDMARRVDNGERWSEAIVNVMPSLRSFADVLADTAWAYELPAADGLWELWRRATFLHVVATNPDLIADRSAWSSYFQATVRFSERTPGATLVDRGLMTTGSDFEADSLFNFRTTLSSGVTIATLHRAKGTEFDVVYIANAIEGVLPDLRTKDSILRTRLLSPYLPENPVEYVQFRLNEERRLAYTAMTRATRRVVWTASEVDTASEQHQPSRFLSQVAERTGARTSDRPLTRRGYEAALRRTLRDHDADPDRRLASLAVLTDPKVGLVDQRFRYGTITHGADIGLVAPDHVTSPSQATTFDTCPRRYVLERFASHRESDSPYLRFGNLVHKVLELTERKALDAGRPRGGRADAQQILEALWGEHGFGDDGVGRSWRRRAESTLDNLYSKWPTSADVVAVEHAVDVDLDGTAWTGKIDRIEHGGGSVRVVDYKTSKNQPTREEAAASLQLGFYLIAAAQDPAIAPFGIPDAAQFWYPTAAPNSKTIKTREFDMDNLPEVRERLITIARTIRAEEFPAIVNDDCDRCDFAGVCPAQPQGREAFLP